MFAVRRFLYVNYLIFLLFSVNSNSGLFGQGTEVDFSTIPKSGTILVYAHMDDDLIWMLPFWKITEKFIGGAMPATPSYRTIISQQQTFLDNNGYNIEYESNWYTPWDDITDDEYTEYYWADNPDYSYLVNDHIETRLYDNPNELSRFEINKVKAKLEQYFASPDMSRAVTHNNWGEYGHKHHVGINKAVRELAVKYHKDVWMLGCDNGGFVDISVPNGITFAYGSFDQPDLYLGIRTIYDNNDRWTWYLDRVPSGDHKFIKIVDAGSDKSGILKGDPITYPGPSQLEPGAYIFDGDDDYMTLKGNNYSSFTISLRFRPTQIREMDISSMAEYPFSTKNDRNIFLTSDGKISARIFDGSSKVVTSNSSVQAGNWSHVAITGNGGNLKLYVNGILEQTLSTGTAITNYATPELVLGLATETASNFMGQIDDVNVYNRALTDTEIAQLSGMVRYITASAGSGGTVTPLGTSSVSIGTNFTYTISPNTGFGISDVLADNVSQGPLSTYTFDYVTEDHTISATFTTLNPFTITSSAGTGGTINPSGTRTVYEGTDETYTISANIGYRIADVEVDGASVGSVYSYTFHNISANHTISSTFTPVPTYQIVASAGSGGSISPGGTVSVSEGSNRTFTINADAGHQISQVLVDGNSVGAVSSYTFTNITSNHTISASFSILKFNLSATSGANGTISPSGVTTRDYGASQTYTIMPSTGYRISNVLVDNVSVGAPSSYTFNNISSDHSISASFSLITYSLNASAGQGGTITPEGNVTASYGTNQTFSVTASTGYYISDVKVDNVSQGPITSYTFYNVTASHNISVTFSPITFSVTSSAGSGGSISPTGNVTVNYGSDRTFAITPSTGFVISDVKVDNVSRGPVTSYTFSYITDDHTIEATFRTATFSMSASAGSGGSINPSGSTTLDYGTSLTYNMTPNTGYRILDVRVDGSSAGPVSSYTFNNISSNHTISANFTIITYTISAISESGGLISPSGDVIANYGSDPTFSISPDEGYYISDVRVDGNTIGQADSYTFENILNDHTISASFAHITFTITATSGSGGTINPGGPSLINFGSNITYNIVPEEGFLISDVKVDDISVGKVSSYTFTNVRSAHKISATFIPITFTINGTAGDGGSISSPGITTVEYGRSLVYSIMPDTGYEIDNVMVDNKSVGAVDTYSFTNIKSNHTISVLFKVITYTVSADYGTGGTLNPDSEIKVEYGSDLSYVIVPDSGYKVLDLVVDGVSLGPASDYTFRNITGDHSISASFKLMDIFTISARAGEGGKINPSGQIMINEGSDQTYLITPDPGYRIYEVVVDNQSAGSVSDFTFTDLSSDHVISVLFSTLTEIKVFPNPFADLINVSIATPGEKLYDIVISDITGKVVLRQNRVPGNSVTPVTLEGSSGIYILRIFYKGAKIATYKIIKA